MSGVNLIHGRLCRSDRWAAYVQTDLMPWALDGVRLGEEVLELGPGPGRTTDWLAEKNPGMTVLEIDEDAAAALAARLGPAVEVVHGDASAMPFPDVRFSGVLSFTMLHHVDSVEMQDRVLSEAFRVLRPGGVLVGSDGLVTPRFRVIHLFDTCVPVDPATLPDRLTAAGFTDVAVNARGARLRFRATRPTG
ncbi:MAG: class I SAM-dependent methyltransferase [Actinomycetes bacterium]